jgi:hypothetical protein
MNLSKAVFDMEVMVEYIKRLQRFAGKENKDSIIKEIYKKQAESWIKEHLKEIV